jgi:hypothetical protein
VTPVATALRAQATQFDALDADPLVATPSCCACCCSCCLTTVFTASVIEATTVAHAARRNGLERGRRVRLALAAGGLLPLAILLAALVSGPLPDGAELVGAVAAPLVVGLWVFVLATARRQAGDDRRTAWRVSGLHALYTVLFCLAELLVGLYLVAYLGWGYLALALGVAAVVWWRLRRLEARSG